MDFAENFSCRSMDEIQTAYWNQTGVTLHPIVVYYMQNGNLKHKSLVMISDDMNLSAGTVMCFIEDLIPQLLEIDPEMMKIHYWPDSPSSQYRNRYTYSMLWQVMGKCTTSLPHGITLTQVMAKGHVMS